MNDALATKLYENIKEANEVRVYEKWHASSIAECPRSHYFKRLGVKAQSTPGAGKMLRWQAGHIIEEVIRPHLLKVYPDLVSNERLENDTLTGEYDNYSEAEQTIFEVKSVHDFAFAYKKKGEQRFHLKDAQPYLNHQLQNHCYNKLLREKGKPVTKITYIYITLDGRIATYEMPVDPSLVSEVDRRLKTLDDAWEAQTPPECLCDQVNHPLYGNTMRWCDFNRGSDCCSLDLLNKGKVTGSEAQWEGAN